MIFGSSKDAAFVNELVAALTKDLPPKLMDSRRGVLSVNKVTRQLEKTFQAAAAYHAEHRLGFIRRASFANSFRWELKGCGYPDDFVDMATEGLVVEVSKARTSTSPDGKK